MTVARTRVSGISDALSNITTIVKFDETNGSVDFARWRREVTQVATNAGQDYRIALPTQRDIESAATLYRRNDAKG